MQSTHASPDTGPGATAPPAPDRLDRPRGRNFRWTIIGVITVLAITNYLDRGNLSVAAPLIRKDLGISATEMGVVLSAFVWPYAIMNLPTGWAIDRFGARVMMSLAAGTWSIIAILTGLARSVGTFVGLRAALGVSEAPMFPAALKATDAWFPDREKAAATSVYISGTQVGLAIAPPISTALMLAFGWPMMFVIMGVLGLVALAGWLVLYRQPENSRWVSAAELAYIRAGQVTRDKASLGTGEKATGREWAGLFAHTTTWVMVIGAFCLQYVFWFYITWLPSYLESAQHFTIKHAGLLAALPYLAGTVAVLLGGRISDRLIDRGMEPIRARRYTIAAGALLTAVALLATVVSHGQTVAVVLLTVGMFTYSLSSGPYWALATNVVSTPKLVASMGSIQNFGGFLGGACAPVVTGVIVDHFGGFPIALTVTALLVLVSAVMYGLVLRRRLPI
jgi:sugar phosphate permease